MRLQIWIIAAAFATFGIIAMAFSGWSPAYVGLIMTGVAAFALGTLFDK